MPKPRAKALGYHPSAFQASLSVALINAYINISSQNLELQELEDIYAEQQAAKKLPTADELKEMIKRGR